jgi:hypothetical protein
VYTAAPMVGPPRFGDDDDNVVCLVYAGYNCVYVVCVCVRVCVSARALASINAHTRATEV